jgi:hypothetical protein
MAERQRVETDAPVEPRVEPTISLLVSRDVVGPEFIGTRHASLSCTLCPRLRLLAGVEQEQLETWAELVSQAFDDARVEEEPRRERVRENEPDGIHERGLDLRVESRKPWDPPRSAKWGTLEPECES